MKCPKCGEENNFLLHIEEDLVTYEFSLVNGELEYEEKDRESALSEPSPFLCPNCRTELAHTEQEAIKLLQGG